MIIKKFKTIKNNETMLYRYLLIFGFICLSDLSFALDELPYKRLRLDLNFLGNFSWFNSNSSFGAVGISIEPKYSITKHWSLGILSGLKLRFNPLRNMNLLQQNTAIGSMEGSTPALLFQHQLTADFHLMASKTVRPYLGLGIGVLTNKPLGKTFLLLTKSQKIQEGTANENNLRAFFIVSPRLGIDIWHIRVNLIYDIIVSTKQQLSFKGKIPLNGQKSSEIIGTRPNYNNLTGQIIFYLGGGKNKND